MPTLNMPDGTNVILDERGLIVLGTLVEVYDAFAYRDYKNPAADRAKALTALDTLLKTPFGKMRTALLKFQLIVAPDKDVLYPFELGDRNELKSTLECLDKVSKDTLEDIQQTVIAAMNDEAAYDVVWQAYHGFLVDEEQRKENTYQQQYGTLITNLDARDRAEWLQAQKEEDTAVKLRTKEQMILDKRIPVQNLVQNDKDLLEQYGQERMLRERTYNARRTAYLNREVQYEDIVNNFPDRPLARAEFDAELAIRRAFVEAHYRSKALAVPAKPVLAIAPITAATIALRTPATINAAKQTRKVAWDGLEARHGLGKLQDVKIEAEWNARAAAAIPAPMPVPVAAPIPAPAPFLPMMAAAAAAAAPWPAAAAPALPLNMIAVGSGVQKEIEAGQCLRLQFPAGMKASVSKLEVWCGGLLKTYLVAAYAHLGGINLFENDGINVDCLFAPSHQEQKHHCAIKIIDSANTVLDTVVFFQKKAGLSSQFTP